MIAAKPASALFYYPAVLYVVWVCGRMCLWWDERCDWFQNVYDRTIRLAVQIGLLKLKKNESEKPFWTVQEDRFGLQTKRALFD